MRKLKLELPPTLVMEKAVEVARMLNIKVRNLRDHGVGFRIPQLKKDQKQC